MPRIPFSLIHRARRCNSLLPLLLGPCRDLRSAANELRWLRDHALAVARKSVTRESLQTCLRRLCKERATGKPLQYVIGNQPFGELNILCERGVLIPRPETESITLYLAQRLRERESSSSKLRVLDLCTGTGCISLLLYKQLLGHAQVKFLGIDSSSSAIGLARRNLAHNLNQGSLLRSAREEVYFAIGDIFGTAYGAGKGHDWDVLVANPPYISPNAFRATTTRSVSKWEPKSALVPPEYMPSQSDVEVGDAFYPRLLEIANEVGAKVFLVEVADLDQAKRVAGLALKQRKWASCEIWRDCPGQEAEATSHVPIRGHNVPILGTGNGRAVFAYNDWV